MDRRLFLKSSLAIAALARFGWTKEPPVLNPEISVGNNQFALELFARLRKEDGNLFCSPFSVSTALAMTSVGARGKTAEEMNQVLHLPPDRDAAHKRFAALIQQLNGAGGTRGYQLAVANALWGAKGCSFLPEFLDFTRKYYGAGLTELDFENETEKSRQIINHWVEKETRDKIKELLPKGIILPDTRLVLTNAIYFKGDWAEKFDRKATVDELFQLADGQKVKTPIMHRNGDYGYFENELIQMLSIAIKGKELSMIFVLPRKKGMLPEVEAKATPDSVRTWLAGIRGSEVNVALPKFEITRQTRLKDTLRDMGMITALTPAADFSGMSAKEGLMISDVIHKAYVAVNEEGAEAAAATAVVMKPTAMPVQRNFRADHPFLFMIRDNRSGSILFIGRMADPRT
jgi:serpin B